MTDAAHAAWSELLDRFERDLDEPAVPLAPWIPPREPLPTELAERAGRVLSRQQERMRRTREELAGVREQLAAVRRAAPARDHVPAYLDVDA